jgi:hypothetical protein
VRHLRAVSFPGWVKPLVPWMGAGDPVITWVLGWPAT